MAKLEFFYDYSSPWTYLAFTKVEEVCRRAVLVVSNRDAPPGCAALVIDRGV